jgi:hypothetical protein
MGPYRAPATTKGTGNGAFGVFGADLNRRGDPFGEALGDHDRREVREPGWPIRDDRGVDDTQSFRSVHAPRGVDYVAFLGRGHRARPDDVGKGVAVRADHIPQLVGIAFG